MPRHCSKPKAENHNHRQDDRLDRLEIVINSIESNALPHLVSAMNDTKECLADVKIDLAIVKNDVSWLTKFFWVMITASVGGLLTGLINLFFNVKR